MIKAIPQLIPYRVACESGSQLQDGKYTADVAHDLGQLGLFGFRLHPDR